MDQQYRNEKLIIHFSQYVAALRKHSALNLHTFQIGTFGMEVTTRPAHTMMPVQHQGNLELLAEIKGSVSV